jgi:predicted lipoprotein with Yx(FWY)xxD motif
MPAGSSTSATAAHALAAATRTFAAAARTFAAAAQTTALADACGLTLALSRAA